MKASLSSKGPQRDTAERGAFLLVLEAAGWFGQSVV